MTPQKRQKDIMPSSVQRLGTGQGFVGGPLSAPRQIKERGRRIASGTFPPLPGLAQ
jgi:hypothetical protein